ncbi:hypothetical protein [Adhaeribacter rhizoryzae]|uniref:Uncharacterized protein n=1 Tax=Adhaeribacter rhizoryzae TaxID=2607907 RepID=A0A5M6D0Y9_9BACT|nr:hypothetical protein [Adhaeribacter rhizoryzae]KAA5539952.1 hypothetical protein F0145_23475 [Adhaeribacter rhizoryzae]
MTRPAELYILYFLLLMLSLNALVGGGALILDPQGSLMDLNPDWLQNTPFNSYLVPGLLLFTFIGLLPLFALISLLFRPNWHWANVLNIFADKYWGWTYSLFTGIILITWIIVQEMLTHYFLLHTVFIIMGILIILLTLLPRVQKYYSQHH